MLVHARAGPRAEDPMTRQTLLLGRAPQRAAAASTPTRPAGRSLAKLRGPVVLMGLALSLAACGAAEEPAEGSYSTVGDGWSDLGISGEDGAGGAQGDASAADAGGAADSSGATDSSAPDTGAPDTGTPDTGAPDAGAADTGPTDTGTLDTGAPDAGATDTGATDTGGGVCQDKSAAYASAKVKALKCTSDFQCYAPAKLIEGKGFTFGAPENIGCDCKRYYSDVDLAGQSLADLDAEFTKAGCKAQCPLTACASLDTRVGVCTSGQCETKQATCKEMEALVEAAVTKGRACKADSECSGFGMQGGLPCGCPVNVNLSTLAPGKPLFLYVTMITRAYTNLGCAKGVNCACAKVGKGACVNGMCTTK